MSRYSYYKFISRLMALLLAFVLILPCVPVARAAGGSCGKGLDWSFSAGTLTISGSGAMTNYTYEDRAPWHALRDEIVRLELSKGLTHIGDLAFYECDSITAVSIPNSVESIGDFAFTYCSGMELLNLGSVRTIGEAAFSGCYALRSLELPGSLTAIGMKSFYRCESITSVTVPSSVKTMGVSVFAYCKNLVSADVRASISSLPEYTFYGCERLSSLSLPDTTGEVGTYSFRGCDNLSTVYYDGTAQTPEQIQKAIGTSAPDFGDSGFVNTESSIGSVTTDTVQEKEDGNLVNESITVTPGANSSVSTKVETSLLPDEQGSGSAEITVTVNGQQGWEEAKETTQKELESVTQDADKITINVYIKDTDAVDAGFVDALAGKPVELIITTQNGSIWKVNTSQLEASTGAYNLSYTLTEASEELTEQLGGNACVLLSFVESAQVNSEVVIHLGSGWAYNKATLLQMEKDGHSRIQTVVVDDRGYAHFYLASVDKKTQYCIAMNLPILDAEESPIVPQTLKSTYGDVVNHTPIQYEITGRSSSWGMELGQVMGILAAVMGSMIVIVGVVMFVLNKRRVKNGYVPQWDDEDDEY